MNLILGNSSSEMDIYIIDKYIKKSIENIHQKYYIIIPDQFSQAMEELVLRLHSREAFINIEILSFTKLASHILIDTRKEKELLTELEEEIILRKILLKNAKKLEVFRGKYNKNGFINEVKTLIDEMYTSKTDTHKFTFLPKEELGEGLFKKLNDLSLIIDEFNKELGDKKIAKKSLITKATEVVHLSERLDNASFLFVGHQTFDMQQYGLIESLMMKTENLNFAFSLPQGFKKTSLTSIFDLPRQTIDRLIDLGSLSGKKTQIIEVYEKFDILRTKPLEHLIKNLFAFEVERLDTHEGIELCLAKNIKAELLSLVSKINSLVREKGYRFDDIVVICSRLVDNEVLIKKVFDEARIPYFFDISKPLRSSPLSRFLKSIREVILLGPRVEVVIALIKSGVVYRDLDMISKLENDILKEGHRTYKAYRNWAKEDEQIVKLNTTLDFIRKIKSAKNLCKETCEQLRKLVEYLGLKEELDVIAKNLYEEGNPELAQQYEQLYDTFIDMLTALEASFAGEKNTEVIWKILDSLLENIKIGVIPKKLDVVSIGDISRSKFTKKKVAFIINANDTQLINLEGNFAIFSQTQRNTLKNFDIDFGEISNTNTELNKLKFYEILTRIKEKIYFSYSYLGLGAEPLSPDPIVLRLQEIFPTLEVEKVEEDIVYAPSTPKEALSKVATDTYMNPNLVKPLINLLSRYDELADKIKSIELGQRTSKTVYTLDDISLKGLYEDELRFSISKLETFNKCPFSYFLGYNLFLKDREVSTITTLDDGSLMHYVMEKFFTEHKTNFGGLISSENSKILNEVVKYIDEYILDRPMYTRTEKAIFKLKSLANRITSSIYAYCYQLSKGSFEVESVERKFGIDFSVLGRLVKLNGVIDRLDKADLENDKSLFRIVDYKSSKKMFNYSEFKSGISLQLPTYALTQDASGSFCAGINYLELQTAWQKVAIEDLVDGRVDEKRFSEYRFSGLVVDRDDILKAYDEEVTSKGKSIILPKDKIGEDSFLALKSATKTVIGDTITKIVQGDISPYPFKTKKAKGCTYCIYKSVCGFDEKNSAFRYRELEDFSVDELASTGGENELD